jgi:hypothetical protein
MRIVVLVLVFLTATASADRNAAEKLFRAGEKAYKGQRFLHAARNFEEAYKELPAPEIAFSAAQAYRRQYRVDSTHPEYAELAVKYYKIYLADAKETGKRLGDAADSLGEMLRVLERVGSSGKTVTQEQKPMLVVSVVFADRMASQPAKMEMHEVDEARMDSKDEDKNGPVAKAFVDGKPVELDALTEVTAGDHTVRAEAEGYKPIEQVAHVVAGVPRPAELVLQPLPAQVSVNTEEGANIIVDGRGIGEVKGPLELAGGSHVISIVRLGRKPVAREVVVTRDQKLTLAVDLEPTTRRRSVPWVIGLGGVAVVGTGFFLLGAKHYDTQAREQLTDLDTGDQPQSVLDDYNKFRNRRDLAIDFAIISGGAAVAIGLTAAWLYYFDTPSAEGVKVVPYGSGTGGGAAISGRF